MGDKTEVLNEAPAPIIPALNPSSLNEEQIESADKAERHKIAQERMLQFQSLRKKIQPRLMVQQLTTCLRII
jgi:hypothetical protein